MTGSQSARKHRTVTGRSVRSIVVEELRTMIISGELAAGAAVSEVVLAAEFGVSRTPIREALKELQVEGLVEIRAQVGTFVASPSLESLEEMSIVRGALESLAAACVARLADPETLAALESNLLESERAAERDDVSLYATLVPEFHGLILEGSRNETLCRFHTMLVNQLSYSGLVKASLGKPGRSAQSIAEHKAIYEAICSGDPGAAEQAMKTHVEHAHENTMGALRESAAAISGAEADIEGP